MIICKRKVIETINFLVEKIKEKLKTEINWYPIICFQTRYSFAIKIVTHLLSNSLLICYQFIWDQVSTAINTFAIEANLLSGQFANM